MKAPSDIDIKTGRTKTEFREYVEIERTHFIKNYLRKGYHWKTYRFWKPMKIESTVKEDT